MVLLFEIAFDEKLLDTVPASELKTQADFEALFRRLWGEHREEYGWEEEFEDWSEVATDLTLHPIWEES